MQKVTWFLCATAFVFGATAITGYSDAAVIFSNYASGDAHSTTSGWGITYGDTYQFGSDPPDWDEGMAFTPSGFDYYLDTIELTVMRVRGTNELDLWLMSDDNGQPGTVIEAFRLSDAMGGPASSQLWPPLMVSSTLRPVLCADTQYWLLASVPVEGSTVNWFANSTGDSGPRALWNTDHWELYTSTRGAFRVSGAVVPAPGAFVLGGIGVGLVGWLRRRRTL